MGNKCVQKQTTQRRFGISVFHYFSAARKKRDSYEVKYKVVSPLTVVWMQCGKSCQLWLAVGGDACPRYVVFFVIHKGLGQQQFLSQATIGTKCWHSCFFLSWNTFSNCVYFVQVETAGPFWKTLQSGQKHHVLWPVSTNIWSFFFSLSLCAHTVHFSVISCEQKQFSRHNLSGISF